MFHASMEIVGAAELVRVHAKSAVWRRQIPSMLFIPHFLFKGPTGIMRMELVP